MDTELIIIVSVFGAAWLLMFIIALVLCCQVRSLRKKLADITSPRIRVQKLTVDNDTKNHAFHNPAISPDEELSKRGYSMYVANEETESGRGTERQTGGQFVEELSRELEHRHQRTTAPPFLLHSIEDNKRRTRDMANPVANQNHNNHNNHGNHNSQGNHVNHGNHNSQGNHNSHGNHNSQGNHNSHGNHNSQGNHNSHANLNNHGAFNSHNNYNANSSTLHSNQKGFGNHNAGRQSDTNPNFIY